MGRSRLVAFACLSLAPFAACQCDDPLYAVSGQLAGTVCDEDTGLPLSFKKVRLEGAGPIREAQTAMDGTFEMLGVAAGRAALFVPARDGDEREIDVEIVADQTTLLWDEACRGDPEAGGRGRIEGEICDRHTGSFVQQAQVAVVLPDGSALETATDEEGRFALEDVPAGEHVVSVFAVGYQRSFLVQVFPGETALLESTGDCRPALGHEGFVSGSFCDPETGGPLVAARVRAVDPAGDVHEEQTDTTGSFLLGPMASGTIEVQLEREPDVSLTIPAFVPEGGEAVLESPFSCGSVGPGEGRIEGRVCAPDGSTWLAGAEVYVILDDGTRIETTTDGEGRYALEGLPPGEHEVHIVAGSFETILVVEVGEDETAVVIPETECAIDQDVRIAVVAGMWDDVRSVLVNVGIDEGIISDYSYSWAYELLGDYQTLAQYDIVMINCGADEYEFLYDSIYQQNLRQFVESGGSLYVSDQAYDIVEKAFSEYLDFHGDDLVPSAAEQGMDAASIPGTIVDAVLSASLGTTAIDLHYPLGYWAVVAGASPDVRVFIRGDADTWDGSFHSNVPHTVSFRHGQGKVVYSSFHQEPGINVQMERVLQLLVFQL